MLQFLTMVAHQNEMTSDRAALVHCAVALRDLVEWKNEIENLTRIDLAVPHLLDQLGQVASHRSGPP